MENTAFAGFLRVFSGENLRKSPGPAEPPGWSSGSTVAAGAVDSIGEVLPEKQPLGSAGSMAGFVFLLKVFFVLFLLIWSIQRCFSVFFFGGGIGT